MNRDKEILIFFTGLDMRGRKLFILDNVFTSRFIGQEVDLNKLKSLVMATFKIDSDNFRLYHRMNKGESYLLQVNCAIIGRILNLLGALHIFLFRIC